MNLAALLSAVGGPASTARKLALGLGAALALAVLLGWLCWSRASLKADLAQAEAGVATLQTANRAKAKALEDMRAVAATTDKALAQRELALQNITAQREALRQQITEEVRNDPEARAWFDVPLPAAVRRVLQ